MTDKAKPKNEQPSDGLDKDGTEEGSQMAISDPLREDDQDTTGTTLLPDESDEEDKEQDETVVLPTFPESVYAGLPEFLKKVVSIAGSEEEKDVLLIGSIVVLGAGMSHLFGWYDDMKVSPNLYFLLIAKASADKDILKWCKHLVMPVDLHLRHQSAILLKEYSLWKKEYPSNKLKTPNIKILQKPQEQTFFIPANLSAAKMYDLLSGNKGQGLIIDTGGDHLSLVFKSRHSHYLDVYHKAFHHEPISRYRETNQKVIEINYPQLSTVLAGTNQQVATLIPDVENRLSSRFIFYCMNIQPERKNVFARDEATGLLEHFSHLGDEYLKLYETLKAGVAIEFTFTERQKEEFHHFFSQLQEKYLALHGMDYMGTIRRMGLIAFRIAMIFNGLRILETGDFSPKQECLDVDFYATLSMIKVLIMHSGHVFNQLQEEV